jgi:hypothetical protein
MNTGTAKLLHGWILSDYELLGTTGIPPGRRANGTYRRCGNGRLRAWAGIAADASE